LKRIWRYIALDSEAAADRLLLRIEDLAMFPQSGSPRDDIRPSMRMLVVAGYRILHEYEAADDFVTIVAVVEPYRNIDEMF
jgi:toxin ParE1/3/4